MRLLSTGRNLASRPALNMSHVITPFVDTKNEWNHSFAVSSRYELATRGHRFCGVLQPTR